MKMPVHCPLCHIKFVIQPLSSEIYAGVYCNCEETRNFISFAGKQDTVYEIILRISFGTRPLVYAKWLFKLGEVRIETEDKPNIYLPWFDPDFSDLPALVAKINTYILFS